MPDDSPSNSKLNGAKKKSVVMRNIEKDQTNIQLKHYHIEKFWERLTVEMNDIKSGEENFKHEEIPLSSIGKMMALGRGSVKAAVPNTEATMVMARASELLVMEMITRSFLLCSEGNRNTIEKIDVDNTILKNEEYDLFSLIVERNPEKE
mmetsp:Transcript_17178/g.16503  ORF Transcript_17178/g.16503 Transcript_17178/m.16503 type:complete len:150 (-) Transcript_17178:131-580(-)|eukprot:CAMPEP_0119035684 /NCGR_PEP_ID=MMETSP1177-20130426/2875_1 /TAXON_ID=2985 /ORGANISM="Ochromonas sp, Strain CCMP1899" /LENGTH=149 /DNA_ID=CAMNT_0006994325 /DNA_START=73 /DNA_END=522 /DNA_ORIENTATION=-